MSGEYKAKESEKTKESTGTKDYKAWHFKDLDC